MLSGAAHRHTVVLIEPLRHGLVALLHARRRFHNGRPQLHWLQDLHLAAPSEQPAHNVLRRCHLIDHHHATPVVLDRIDALTITAETFAPRELVRQRLPASGTRVVVRFDPTVVRWVREAQHYTFVDEREDDRGGVVMVYQVAAAQHIVGWLLRWGSQMEVLEPMELRAAIVETAARMQERHHDEPSGATYSDH